MFHSTNVEADTFRTFYRGMIDAIIAHLLQKRHARLDDTNPLEQYDAWQRHGFFTRVFCYGWCFRSIWVCLKCRCQMIYVQQGVNEQFRGPGETLRDTNSFRVSASRFVNWLMSWNHKLGINLTLTSSWSARMDQNRLGDVLGHFALTSCPKSVDETRIHTVRPDCREIVWTSV